MFLGKYEHSIDEKNRLTVPARYRSTIGEVAYITEGFDHNLIVFPAKTYEQISHEIMETSITDPNARELRRMFFSNAAQSEVDRAGRILIPSFLRELAGIKNDAVIIGNGTYFEIWAPERWQEKNNRIGNSEDHAEKFTDFKIRI